MAEIAKDSVPWTLDELLTAVPERLLKDRVSAPDIRAAAKTSSGTP